MEVSCCGTPAAMDEIFLLTLLDGPSTRTHMPAVWHSG